MVLSWNQIIVFLCVPVFAIVVGLITSWIAKRVNREREREYVPPEEREININCECGKKYHVFNSMIDGRLRCFEVEDKETK